MSSNSVLFKVISESPIRIMQDTEQWIPLDSRSSSSWKVVPAIKLPDSPEYSSDAPGKGSQEVLGSLSSSCAAVNEAPAGEQPLGGADVNSNWSREGIAAALDSQESAEQAAQRHQTISDEDSHEIRALTRPGRRRAEQATATTGGYRPAKKSFDPGKKNVVTCLVLAAGIALFTQSERFAGLSVKPMVDLGQQAAKLAPQTDPQTSHRVAPVVASVQPRHRHLASFRKSTSADAESAYIVPVPHESLAEYTGPESMRGVSVSHRHAYQTAMMGTPTN